MDGGTRIPRRGPGLLDADAARLAGPAAPAAGASPAPGGADPLADALERMAELRRWGALSPAEFTAWAARLLGLPAPPPASATEPPNLGRRLSRRAGPPA